MLKLYILKNREKKHIIQYYSYDGELLSTTWKVIFFHIPFTSQWSVTEPKGWSMESSYSFNFVWDGCSGVFVMRL